MNQALFIAHWQTEKNIVAVNFAGMFLRLRRLMCGRSVTFRASLFFSGLRPLCLTERGGHSPIIKPSAPIRHSQIAHQAAQPLS
jgi:hypothetical protein